jgi:hypothetical protein
MSTQQEGVELMAFIDRWITIGERGEPVYLSDVREYFRVAEDALPLELFLERGDGQSWMPFTINLPPIKSLGSVYKNFVFRYLEATVYNIVSSYGGRSLRIVDGSRASELKDIVTELSERFGTAAERTARNGLGRSLNVAERMSDALFCSQGSRFEIALSTEPPRIHTRQGAARRGSYDLQQKLLEVPSTVEVGLVVGIDVGGSNVKIVAIRDGHIVGYKAHEWFPARFESSEEFVSCILGLAKWGRARCSVAALADPALRDRLSTLLDSVDAGDTPIDRVFSAATVAEHTLGSRLRGLDAIGMCFPDVVVNDKIVGGEVYKTRGIRERQGDRYESEFKRITDIDKDLRTLCSEKGRVKIINDGAMAAFTAAVERAIAGDESVGAGIFAHSLGTELGTGWINRDGRIPDIPLEIYNYVIDVGSDPATLYPPDDPRSTLNFNTGVPGTLQKYVSQSGVFRLALELFERDRPDLYEEIVVNGYITRGAEGLRIPESPRDMRRPFLDFLMKLPSRDDDTVVAEVFRKVGEFLGRTYVETEEILKPGLSSRMVFGGLVRDAHCFELIREGARRIAPELKLVAADEDLAVTPLMRQLRDDGRYPVAQFALAVGAAHYVCGHKAVSAGSESSTNKSFY